MSKRRPKPSIIQPDPDTERWASGAITNKAALSPKQKRDAKRIQIKIDVGQWPIIKQVLDAIAQDLGTSSSQAGAQLLAEGMIQYLIDDHEIPRLPSRSPRFRASVDLQPVADRLTTLADRSGVLDWHSATGP